MEPLKSYLSEIYAVEKVLLDDYVSFWTPFHMPKKQLVTTPGQVEKHLYFVTSGIQKSYFLHSNKAHIIAFAYAPSLSGIPESFFTQTPSRYYLETITESDGVKISYERHHQFLIKYRDIERLFRKITEIFLNGVIQRQHEVMALSMEERFRKFVERSPHLLQLIPQKDLASYLNIDATNFSKLINRIHI